MKRFVPWVTVSLIVGFFCFTGKAVFAENPKLPVMGGKQVLATVNGDPVTLEGFLRVMASIHEDTSEKQIEKSRNLSVVLDRLINIKLIYQEALNIGLDELEEVIIPVEEYRKKTLRQYLYAYHVRNITKPDKKDVERIYGESVKELKVTSLLMEREEDVKALEAGLKSGEDFDELARRMTLEGKAKGGEESRYIKSRELNPAIAGAIANLKIGDTTPVIPLEKKFTILKLEDIRFPENEEARERARAEALKQKKIASMKQYAEALKKKYARIDEGLLNSLDFDAKEPGMGALAADKRVLAEVQGGKPVTVGELAETVGSKYFHGAERMAEKKKLNVRKFEVLDEILLKQVVDKEAKRLKIDRNPEYKAQVDEFKQEIVFAAFVQKAILPELKVDEGEIRTYYEKHASEFRSPEMFKIRVLAFTAREDAEDALGKLNNGADFQWVNVYASGQVEPQKSKDLFEWGGKVLAAEEFPAGVRQAVSRANSGDFRFYASPEGPYCVLNIEEVLPSRTRSLEEMKNTLANEVLREKSMESLNSWLDKLKAAYKVKIFAREETLGKIIEKQYRSIPKN